MKQVFLELIAFLRDNEDSYFYDSQFDAETLETLIMGFCKEFEGRIH